MFPNVSEAVACQLPSPLLEPLNAANCSTWCPSTPDRLSVSVVNACWVRVPAACVTSAALCDPSSLTLLVFRPPLSTSPSSLPTLLVVRGAALCDEASNVCSWSLGTATSVLEFWLRLPSSLPSTSVSVTSFYRVAQSLER